MEKKTVRDARRVVAKDLEGDGERHLAVLGQEDRARLGVVAAGRGEPYELPYHRGHNLRELLGRAAN